MNVRQQSILDRLEKQESCSYQELADRLGVSAMTIRRDVDVLSRGGAVIKTLRGVRQGRDPSSAPLYEKTLFSRMNAQLREKRAIAETAVTLIGNRQTVYLDGSTTCLEMARTIAGRCRGLTVVTNSALVCLKVGGSDANTVVGIGGQYDPNSASFVGPVAEEAARNCFVDVAFFSTKGIVVSEGTFESSAPTFRIKQIIAGQCPELILLADHTKFGQRALSKVIDISQIHGIVTDGAAPKAALAALKRKGKRVWMARLGDAEGERHVS